MFLCGDGIVVFFGDGFNCVVVVYWLGVVEDLVDGVLYEVVLEVVLFLFVVKSVLSFEKFVFVKCIFVFLDL